jgi:nucleolar protein 58
VDRHSENLRAAGKHLKEISGIDTQDWNIVKLAGALKLIFYSEEKFPAAFSPVCLVEKS